MYEGDEERRLRLHRKLDHVRLAVEAENGSLCAGFSDVHLIHRALPRADLESIRLDTHIWGRDLPSPFFVDAMTGGPREMIEVNRALGRAAGKAGWGMALGSQTILLACPETAESFQLCAKWPPSMILANMPAAASTQDVIEAFNTIRADAVQLHLNILQELLMAEGDRGFGGVRSRIAETVRTVSAPVMVKEVGCGIGFEDARELAALGARGINVAGAGGTSFARIELARRSDTEAVTVDPGAYHEWGIPTVASLVESVRAMRATTPRPVVVASGGVRTPLDAVKCLVLGADLVALAAPILRKVLSEGEEATTRYLVTFNQDVRRLLLLIGADRPIDARTKPYVLGGFTGDWLKARGFSDDQVFRRGR